MSKSKIPAFCAMAICLALLCSCVDSIQEYVPDEPTVPVTPAQSEQEPEPEPEPIPTLITVVLAEEMPDLSFYGELSRGERAIFDLVYLRPIVTIDGKTVSDVLAAWERIGGFTWSITLREGICDGNGRAFTANEFAACLGGEELGNVSVVDDFTLEVTLGSRDAGIMERLLSETYLTFDTDCGPDELPVGFGPYEISEIGKNTVLLSRSEGAENLIYEGATEMLSAVPDTVLFVFESDAAVRAELAANKSADVIFGLGEAETDAEGYSSALILDNECVSLFFNMDEDRLMTEKPDLRRAVAAAVNPEAYLSAEYMGAVTGGSILPANMGLWENAGQDIEAAEKFVYSARYRDQELVLIYSAEYEDLAQITEEQCSAAGMNITILEVENVLEYAASEEADWDMAIATVKGYGDAELTYSKCFEAGENGKTWFNFSDSNVLYVTEIMGLQAGHDAGNAKLFEDWLRSSRTVIGLYTPGSMCLTANTAGEPSITENGVIIGSLIPVEPVEP